MTWFSSAVRIGMDALRAHPLRTTLSTLGMIIGVASLVAVLSLGDGMERTARAQLETTTGVLSLGIASRTVESADGDYFPLPDTLPLHPDDIALIIALPGIATYRQELAARHEVHLGHGDQLLRRMVSIRGRRGTDSSTTPLAAGRALQAADDDPSRGGPIPAVASALLAKRLSPNASLVGQTVTVQGDSFRVVGVEMLQPGPPVQALEVPYGVLASRLVREDRVLPGLFLRANRLEDVGAIERAIGEILSKRTPAWKRHYEVVTYQARADQASKGILIFKLLMGAITGISLLVGGIGIMNAMLASVSERTREIGIRRATGATRRDIRMQFLTESVAIAGSGGLLGIVLGLLGAFGITALIRAFADAPFVQASFGWSSVLAAAASAVVVGLAFGTYPANRAANLSPIDAMRHE